MLLGKASNKTIFSVDYNPDTKSLACCGNFWDLKLIYAGEKGV